MSDLEIDRPHQRGDRGAKVRLIQEWLSLNDFGVVPDGRFGPATEGAVRAFQARKKLPVGGVVDDATFQALIAPMRAALAPRKPRRGLGATFTAYARAHLKVHPREVGGQNMGPWVRLYMAGNEGPQFPWCAGFVCFVLKQACTTLNRPLPMEPSMSCDSLAASAKERGLFVGEHERDATLPRGALFLNRLAPRDWTHVGLVTRFEADTMSTIEGNTNDEGSREGHEVCARTRGYGDKDFILIR